MKTFTATLALAFGAEALTARNGNCCFQLTATGGPGGPVGQLGDGQNRIGQGLPSGQYCIDSNGGLTDGQGRGCIFTGPTTQWQCDVGATPMSGFSVGCDGALSYNGNNKFDSCPTGDNGGFNIYSKQPANQQGCVQISLTADACKSGCPAPTPPPPPKPTAKACPADLTGNWEFPHLIVPVDSSKPDTALGTSYNGEVSPTVSSIFNFDIPNTDAGKTCSLVFLFPEQSALQTSSFTRSGSGDVGFASLMGPADLGTSYNNAPKVAQDLGKQNLAPGFSYTITSFPCPAGQRVAYKMSSSGDTCLNYFQDYNPCPIGLYVTVSN